MIGYVVTDNTAVRIDTHDVIMPWTGDVTRPGFYIRNDTDLLYVERKTGRILLATNLDLSPEREYSDYYYYSLFNQPDNGWHTGNRIRYRDFEPVEWIFD